MLTSKNIEKEIEKLSSLADENHYQFSIDLQASSYNGDPDIYIKINETVYYDLKFTGTKNFKIDVFLQDNIDCDLILGMRNKTTNNTLVKDDKIIADQNVKILDIKINKLSLVKKNLFFWDHSKYIKNPSNEILYKQDGLYFDGDFILPLKTPIFPFLMKKFYQQSNDIFENKTISSEQRQQLIDIVFD